MNRDRCALAARLIYSLPSRHPDARPGITLCDNRGLACTVVSAPGTPPANPGAEEKARSVRKLRGQTGYEYQVSKVPGDKMDENLHLSRFSSQMTRQII